MSNDLLNILSHSNKDIDNQKLIDYINGKLSGNEKHEVEKWMIDNHFENEAMEGLQSLREKKDLNTHVDQLNKALNKYLQQKKQRRSRRKIKEISWSYFSIILVLLLIIIAYFVIRMVSK